MATPLATGTAVRDTKKSLPSLTWPQSLAFAAFVVTAGFALFHEARVSAAEFHEVRKLAVFLIGALLPSDAVIRFGRNLFLKSAAAKAIEAAEKEPNSSDNPAEHFVPTTLAQLLAFVTFVIIAALTLANGVIDSPKGHDVVKVAVFLIAALLPSEAGIRFGRALYLRDAPGIDAKHLKKI